mmetsp:Transcript_19604/g.29089  ORF Transcript_19604/g.29089 Transcript_19604/m.29089 type:complete len:174 (+) Transcript_19604:258-779(+)
MDAVNVLTLIALPLATFFCVFVIMWWCMFWNDGHNQTKQEKKKSKNEQELRDSDIARTASKEESENTPPEMLTKTDDVEQGQRSVTRSTPFNFLQRITRQKTENGIDSTSKTKADKSDWNNEVPALIIPYDTSIATGQDNDLGRLELVEDSNSLESLDIYTRCDFEDNYSTSN